MVKIYELTKTIVDVNAVRDQISDWRFITLEVVEAGDYAFGKRLTSRKKHGLHRRSLPLILEPESLQPRFRFIVFPALVVKVNRH